MPFSLSFSIRPLPALAAGASVFVLAALVPASAPAAPAGESPVSAIRENYSDFDSAFQRLDAEAVTSLFAPQYQGVDEHGKVSDLAQTRAGLTGLFHVLSTPVHDVSNTLTTVHSTIQSVKVSGNTAMVRVREQVEWTERGVIIPAIFEDHALDSTDIDTWRKTADGWKMVHSSVVSAHVTHGPLRGKEEATAAIQRKDSQARTDQALEFSRQMSQMRDDQFNEYMYRSHMDEINHAINRIPHP